MKKAFFAILIFGFLVVAQPASAKITDLPFFAALIKFVQNTIIGEEKPLSPPGEGEEFVDPREVQQVLREIKDMKKELNRLSKQLAKLSNVGDDINQINNLLSQISGFEIKVKADQDLRETIQDFRDAQIWDGIQKFRAKIEIPKETKQWDKEIKRIEKLLSKKKTQVLSSEFGLNLDILRTKIDEIKTGLAKVQQYYNSSDLESAMEEFDDMRQDFHPGEINSVLQRLSEVQGRLNAVKDAEIKNKIKETLAEITSDFNEGEYRIARELMDESFAVISWAPYVGKKTGYTKEKWLEAMEKAEERGEQLEMRRKPEEESPSKPAQPTQPAQPKPTPTPTPTQTAFTPTPTPTSTSTPAGIITPQPTP